MVASLAKLKIKSNFRSFFSSTFWYGTLIFGLFQNTFCINIIDSNIAIFDNVKNHMFESNQMFPARIILGIVQIIFGLAVKVVNQTRQFGWQYGMTSVNGLF